MLLAPTFAVVEALTHGWQPNGDDATIALRTAGILDGQLPVTGMRSTSGDGIDVNLSTHHLGPLQFYLLALPHQLMGAAAVNFDSGYRRGLLHNIAGELGNLCLDCGAVNGCSASAPKGR